MSFMLLLRKIQYLLPPQHLMKINLDFPLDQFALLQKGLDYYNFLNDSLVTLEVVAGESKSISFIDIPVVYKEREVIKTSYLMIVFKLLHSTLFIDSIGEP